MPVAEILAGVAAVEATGTQLRQFESVKSSAIVNEPAIFVASFVTVAPWTSAEGGSVVQNSLSLAFICQARSSLSDLQLQTQQGVLEELRTN